MPIVAAQPVAAQVLLTVLQEFANRQANAVLAVLQGETPQLQQHYPQAGPLEFADGQWRAFYHCHPSPRDAIHEHGHFHIFYQYRPDDWRHVVALGMDQQGQPRDWFMTNRWVTGGKWLQAADLCVALDGLQPRNVNDALAADWLNAMLCCYAAQLRELAQRRDENLTLIMAGQGNSDTLDNRDIYELASLPVDLVADIEQQLSGM